MEVIELLPLPQSLDKGVGILGLPPPSSFFLRIKPSIAPLPQSPTGCVTRLSQRTSLRDQPGWCRDPSQGRGGEPRISQASNTKEENRKKGGGKNSGSGFCYASAQTLLSPPPDNGPHRACVWMPESPPREDVQTHFQTRSNPSLVPQACPHPPDAPLRSRP